VSEPSIDVSNRRVPLAIALVVSGLVTGSAGLLLLQHLSQIYRTVDVAYRENEQTFYDWLAVAARKHGLKSDHLTRLITQRLLVMGATDRRNAINSMMIDVFWDELAPPGADRTPVFDLMYKTTRIALSSDPLSGELWLFAAWLRTKLAGFDDTASHYFVLAQRFTPRESALVLQRLDFVTELVEKPNADARTAVLADLSVIQQFDPRSAAVYSQKLQQ
jgi:hypothetical protein